MSMDVTQLRGYDASLYNDLKTEVEQSGGMSVSACDRRLITLVNAGQSFADAVDQIRLENPSLTPPNTMASVDLGGLQQGCQASVQALIPLVESAQGQENANMVSNLGQDLSAVIQKAQNGQDDLQLIMSDMMKHMYA